jgi:hypothetical protein
VELHNHPLVIVGVAPYDASRLELLMGKSMVAVANPMMTVFMRDIWMGTRVHGG